MEMLQATVMLLCMFIALLAMLFVALVAGAAAADRARMPVDQRRSGNLRR
ncbi:MAG: hypothetical protein ACYDAR_04370 [Thermomicrobiales bacterium]